MAARPPKVYQLKISLKGLRPPVWRRILVLNTITLAELHGVIQQAMGWYDCHLHEFEIGLERYGPLDPGGWEEVNDESKVKLAQLMRTESTKISYVYDFGDDWVHEILLEKVLPVEPDINYPVCIKGKRACPPEDCGGVWGYAELLQKLKDSTQPDYEELLEWAGGEIDPEAFDLEQVNQNLTPLRSQ